MAALSLSLFRFDLMQTINLRNVEPVGVVIVKKNTVQRRLSNRVLWDRLQIESPVYIGDIIRVAEISAATLHIENNSIDLNENTLIRITRSADSEGLQILLSEGNLSLASGENSGSITLDIDGHQLQAGPGIVLSASTGENGVSVQVSEGTVSFIADGQSREISSGSAVVFDADGIEQEEKSAVIMSPLPNARYINGSREPLPVNFMWSRVNLAPNELLRLEIAEDRNFNQILQSFEDLDNQAQAALNAGLWYWRLSYEDAVLSEGRVTIADGTGPELKSPAMSSVFRYTDSLPVINFQWEETEDALFYILEICDSPDFINPRMRRQGTTASFIDSSMGEGTWYWRVMPVFPSVFEGSSSFSPAAFFNIERAVIEEDAGFEEWLIMETPPEMIPKLFLAAPEHGVVIEGLAALRQQTVFRWDCEAEVTRSRFVLSKNSDPFYGQPAIEIQNPDRTVRVDRLGEGIWYWNVEAQTVEGYTVRAREPRQFQVTPIPLLPAPQNMQPARDYRFGIVELQSQRRIVFNWQTVQGANAYIFALYQQTAVVRRLIIRTEPQTGASYTLDNLGLLDRGTFVWQVEAVNRGRGGVIEQRGRAGESTFILDFPPPAPVQVEETGILYGN